MDKDLVAQTVANRLFATENAIDVALIEASQLLQAMLQARQDLRISAVVGDRAPAQLAQAIAALSAARTAVVETHGELAKYLSDAGYRARAVQVSAAAERGRLLLPTKRRAVAALAVKDPVLRGINCVGTNSASEGARGRTCATR